MTTTAAPQTDSTEQEPEVQSWVPREAPWTGIQGKQIAKKLVQMMKLVGQVPKDKENAYHHYRYVSEEAISLAVQRACIECLIASSPNFFIESTGTLATRSKEIDQVVTAGCHLEVIDADSGEKAWATAYGTGQDAGDKAVMKAQTAAQKNAWMKLLNIPTGDDPEADHKTDERTRGKDQTQKPRPPAPPPAQSQPAPPPPQAPKPTAAAPAAKPATPAPKPETHFENGVYILGARLATSRKQPDGSTKNYYVVTITGPMDLGSNDDATYKRCQEYWKTKTAVDLTWSDGAKMGILVHVKPKEYPHRMAESAYAPPAAEPDAFAPKAKPETQGPTWNLTAPGATFSKGVQTDNTRIGDFALTEVQHEGQGPGQPTKHLIMATNADFYTLDEQIADAASNALIHDLVVRIMASKTATGWRIDTLAAIQKGGTQ